MTIPSRRLDRRGSGALAAVAVLVAAAGVLLPVETLVEHLTVEGSAAPGQIRFGAWVLKGALILNGAVLWLIGRNSWRGSDRDDAGSDAGLQGPGEPLAGFGRTRDTDSGSRRVLAVVGAVLVLAAIVRLIGLGEELWFDEIVTLVREVNVPIPRILGTYESQNQHPFYSLLAKGSLELLGPGAVGLRLPAAVLGVGSVWAVYWFGKKLVRRPEALLAAAFLALSYHHVWFSQNARGYTALLLGTLVASGLFLDMAAGTDRDGRLRAPLGYATTMALTTYAHATGFVVVLGHAAILSWLLLRTPGAWGRDRVRRLVCALLLATTFTLLCYALTLPQVLEAVLPDGASATQVAWQDPLWMLAETVRGLARGVPGGVFLVAAGGVVAGVGVTSFVRARPSVAAMMIVPAFLLIVPLLATRHNLWPRFFFFSAGFGALIVVRGLHVVGGWVRRGLERSSFLSLRFDPLPQGSLGAVFTVLCIIGSALTLPSAWGPKQAYAEAAAYVDARVSPGDEVVTVSMTVIPYREYLGRSWETVESVAELRRIEARARKTWLLYTFPRRLQTVLPGVWDRIQRDYRRMTVFRGTVSGGAILVAVNEDRGAPAPLDDDHPGPDSAGEEGGVRRR